MSTKPGSSSWDPHLYAKQGGFVPELGRSLLDLIEDLPGSRVLDLGCGDGVLTTRLVEAGASVTGLDSSPAMVEAAQASGLDVRLGDGQALEFVDEFDVVFTNAALHWMPQTESVLDGVVRALRPGGQFVGECGGHGNIAAIATALRAVGADYAINENQLNPWTFLTAEHFAGLLKHRGFRISLCVLFPRPTLLPQDIEGWLKTFASSALSAVPLEAQGQFLQRVRRLLEPSLRDLKGRWTADYVRLRFVAVLDDWPVDQLNELGPPGLLG